eukprot:TRINITY_DN7112_c0_g1_i2.p1 TRINITY_DN7112_c0_g1~~TRINITY_DN7112_c0_g1_i2.p1  ORF type:complete len:275 (-),score=-13.29 TRINITY_DN7112_c0_g1_i2:126-950(-)
MCYRVIIFLKIQSFIQSEYICKYQTKYLRKSAFYKIINCLNQLQIGGILRRVFFGGNVLPCDYFSQNLKFEKQTKNKQIKQFKVSYNLNRYANFKQNIYENLLFTRFKIQKKIQVVIYWRSSWWECGNVLSFSKFKVSYNLNRQIKNKKTNQIIQSFVQSEYINKNKQIKQQWQHLFNSLLKKDKKQQQILVQSIEFVALSLPFFYCHVYIFRVSRVQILFRLFLYSVNQFFFLVGWQQCMYQMLLSLTYTIQYYSMIYYTIIIYQQIIILQLN